MCEVQRDSVQHPPGPPHPVIMHRRDILDGICSESSFYSGLFFSPLFKISLTGYWQGSSTKFWVPDTVVCLPTPFCKLTYVTALFDTPGLVLKETCHHSLPLFNFRSCSLLSLCFWHHDSSLDFILDSELAKTTIACALEDQTTFAFEAGGGVGETGSREISIPNLPYQLLFIFIIAESV